MNNEQTLREAFNEFVIKKNVEYYNDMSARHAREIFDFFTTHHRQALERVAGKIESVEFKMNVDEYLPMVENWNRTNFDVPFDHGFAEGKKYALAIIREEI